MVGFEPVAAGPRRRPCGAKRLTESIMHTGSSALPPRSPPFITCSRGYESWASSYTETCTILLTANLFKRTGFEAASHSLETAQCITQRAGDGMRALQQQQQVV